MQLTSTQCWTNIGRPSKTSAQHCVVVSCLLGGLCSTYIKIIAKSCKLMLCLKDITKTENKTWLTLQPLQRWNIFYKLWRTKGFFQFEIIITALVSSFWFIWIPMLLVYSHYKYFYFYIAGIDFSRQNLTSTDVRFWRLNSIRAM